MSLSAVKWSLPFNNNPFGLNDFHSSSFGEFRSEPHFSLFGKSFEEEEDDFKSLEMKLRNGSLLADRGFYDHFDSVFHDGSRRYDLRAAAADQSRRSPQVSKRGKEYVIPIRVETSPKSRTSSTNSISETVLNVSSPKNSTSGASPTRVIEIPVVRETSTTASKQTVGRRDKSRSPVLSHSCKVPTSSFTLLTPTTDIKSPQRRDTAGDVVLDSDAFFTTRTDSSRQSSKPVSDIDIVDVDDDDYFTKSLRRKPLRHFQNTSQDHVFRDLSARVAADSLNKVKSAKDEVERKTADGRKVREKENKSKRSVCCHPGPAKITAAPSYPVYDDLMPILVRQGRQIDYIRGDGNCFFRAISKDVYGTEDCHAECRQAVCDLIQDHPDVFRQYIDDGSVTGHVIDMRVPSTWATTCEIYAAATLLGRDIYVLAPSPSCHTEYHWLLFSPRSVKGAAIGRGGSQRGGEEEEEEVQPCYVTLCHTNANHYDRITPITARCNCQLEAPSLNGQSVMLDLTMSDCEHSQ